MVQGEAEVTQALSDSQVSLSSGDKIHTPPTQGIVDPLTGTWEIWQEFDLELRLSIANEQFTEAMIDEVAIQSAAQWTNTMKVGQMTMNSAVAAKPNLNSVIWGVS